MMSRVLAAGLMSLTLAALPATGASDDPPGAQSKKSPREQFQALLDEHQEAEKTFVQVISKAKTRQERDRVFKETYPDPSKYAVKFLAIADLAAGDPIEVDALVWCVQLGSRSPGGLKASERLAARHAEDKRVGRVAPYLGLTYSPTLETSTLAYAYSPPPEKLLRAIAGSNRDRDARGNATLALGKFLNWRAEFVRGLKDDPKRSEQVKALMASIGQDRADVDRLLATDPEAFVKEAETSFERVVMNYADVSQGRDSLGKLARNELDEIRNLGIGRPCPEITGRDVDGESFKLSDYKGSVVVVDFWGDW